MKHEITTTFATALINKHKNATEMLSKSYFCTNIIKLCIKLLLHHS